MNNSYYDKPFFNGMCVNCENLVDSTCKSTGGNAKYVESCGSFKRKDKSNEILDSLFNTLDTIKDSVGESLKKVFEELEESNDKKANEKTSHINEDEFPVDWNTVTGQLMVDKFKKELEDENYGSARRLIYLFSKYRSIFSQDIVDDLIEITHKIDRKIVVSLQKEKYGATEILIDIQNKICLYFEGE